MRNDIKVKSILKDNGIDLIRYNKNKKAPRVLDRGVEVTQYFGTVVVALNGLHSVTFIENLLADIKDIVIYK